jgi:hypothetical protein
MRWRIAPKSKIRYLVLPIATAIAVLVMVYMLLLGAQAYSAVEASRMLDRLEALRAGSPVADLQQAVRPCEVKRYDSGETYELYAGAFRVRSPWRLLWKLPEEWAYGAEDVLNRLGLRQWMVRVIPTVRDGHIERLSVGVLVAGRYEQLGAGWEVAQRIPERFEDEELSAESRRTYMHWMHLTSFPRSGESFGIYVTPASTEKELQARRVNRSCLFSFRGCDGLCELLPDAIPVLKDRNASFGGCTNVPRSWCELNNDNCRASFK